LGRAIVFHSKADDLTTTGDGFGNAGTRIGCCLITESSATAFQASSATIFISTCIMIFLTIKNSAWITQNIFHILTCIYDQCILKKCLVFYKTTTLLHNGKYFEIISCWAFSLFFMYFISFFTIFFSHLKLTHSSWRNLESNFFNTRN